MSIYSRLPFARPSIRESLVIMSSRNFRLSVFVCPHEVGGEVSQATNPSMELVDLVEHKSPSPL